MAGWLPGCVILYWLGIIEFRLYIFADFSGFERVPVILDGSDTNFKSVLLRSPYVFGIFTVHFPRF